jgi:hypothetical protein
MSTEPRIDRSRSYLRSTGVIAQMFFLSLLAGFGIVVSAFPFIESDPTYYPNPIIARPPRPVWTLTNPLLAVPLGVCCIFLASVGMSRVSAEARRRKAVENSGEKK